MTGMEENFQNVHKLVTTFHSIYEFYRKIGFYFFTDMRARAHTEIEARSGCSLKYSTNLSRSRSAQSLKLLGDSTSQDDKMTILAQLFWLAGTSASTMMNSE